MDKPIVYDHAEELKEYEYLDAKVSDGVTTLLTIVEEVDPGSEDQDPAKTEDCMTLIKSAELLEKNELKAPGGRVDGHKTVGGGPQHHEEATQTAGQSPPAGSEGDTFFSKPSTNSFQDFGTVTPKLGVGAGGGTEKFTGKSTGASAGDGRCGSQTCV